jgi:hypothetical protein
MPSPLPPDETIRPPSRDVATLRISQRKSDLRACLFVGLLLAGVILRLSVVLIADNGWNAPWGGASDAHAYVLLAPNLAGGKWHTFAGHPMSPNHERPKRVSRFNYWEANATLNAQSDVAGAEYR